jgi:hypothetical protein
MGLPSDGLPIDGVPDRRQPRPNERCKFNHNRGACTRQKWMLPDYAGMQWMLLAPADRRWHVANSPVVKFWLLGRPVTGGVPDK